MSSEEEDLKPAAASHDFAPPKTDQLRQKTRETVDTLARLDMPGAIKSLNVSNAAALSLYAARKALS